MLAYGQSWEERRHDLDFDTDGLVIKVNDFGQRRRLGQSGARRRVGLRRSSSTPEEAITRLKDVEITIGKDGTLVLTAHLDPVTLSQTTVSRAGLHNADQIEQKDIRIGDMVIVVSWAVGRSFLTWKRSSLPELRKGRREAVSVPDAMSGVWPRRRCVAEGRVLCINSKDCPAAIKKRVESFAKRARLDIEGLGDSLATQLVRSGMVKSVADLYRLTLAQLTELERMGKKSAQNLLDEIKASKERGLAKVLSGLSIPLVGEATAELLAQAYPSIGALLAAPKEELAEVKGLGPERA